MADSIAALCDEVRSLPPFEEPVATLTLDVSAGPQGTPVAEQVLRPLLASILDAPHWAQDGGLRAWEEAISEAIRTASQNGVRGLYLIGTPGATIELTAALPRPIRNSARLGSLPALFELERYRYLAGPPIVVALPDLHHVDLARVQHGEVLERAAAGVDKHFTRDVRGRTRVAGEGGPAGEAGYTGGHGKNRLQSIIEEHREMVARDAASQLARMLGPDDLLLIAGAPEPRALLLNELPDAIRERAEVLPNTERGATPEAIAERTGDIVSARQLELADAAAGQVLDGPPDTIARGFAACEREPGRLDTLVVHEDLVTHFGDASDAREQGGRASDQSRVEALVRLALNNGTTVRFARSEGLLEHDGVVASLRW